MFIVWGTKVVRRRQGWIAEFCPLCRRPEVHELVRVGQASHVYYLALGQGTLVGFEAKCRACGTTAVTETERYKDASRSPRDRVTDLIEDTHPRLYERHAQRLALEDRVRTGDLTPEERKALIEEPFHIVEGRFASADQTPVDGLGCFSLFVAFAAIFVVSVLSSERSKEHLVPVGMVGLAAAGAFVIYAFATGRRRLARKRWVPLLVRALGPLAPTNEELVRTLGPLRNVRGYAIAKVTDAATLSQALVRSAETRGSAP